MLGVNATAIIPAAQRHTTLSAETNTRSDKDGDYHSCSQQHTTPSAKTTTDNDGKDADHD